LYCLSGACDWVWACMTQRQIRIQPTVPPDVGDSNLHGLHSPNLETGFDKSWLTRFGAKKHQRSTKASMAAASLEQPGDAT